jgi:hypothetical protein
MRLPTRAASAMLATVLAMLAMSNTASADPPMGSRPPTTQPANGADLKGVGGGKADFGMVTFDLSAHQRPGGDALGFGHVGMKIEMLTGTVNVSIDVDCVNVYDQLGSKRAVIAGAIDRVDPPTVGFSVGDRMLIGIDDEGEPPLGADDFFVAADTFFPFLDCRSLIYLLDLENVDSGNITIKLG